MSEAARELAMSRVTRVLHDTRPVRVYRLLGSHRFDWEERVQNQPPHVRNAYPSRTLRRASNQFFSCARLSIDQYGGVGGRNRLDLSEDPAP